MVEIEHLAADDDIQFAARVSREAQKFWNSYSMNTVRYAGTTHAAIWKDFFTEIRGSSSRL